MLHLIGNYWRILLWVNDSITRNPNCGYLQVYFIHKLLFALWHILCSLRMFWNLVEEKNKSQNYLQYHLVSVCFSFYCRNHENLLLSDGLVTFSGVWLFGSGRCYTKIKLWPGQLWTRSLKLNSWLLWQRQTFNFKISGQNDFLPETATCCNVGDAHPR